MNNNALDLIKLVASIQVLLGHAVTHLQIPVPDMFKVYNIFEGVPIFFIISGYLNWGSIKDSRSIVQFIKKRVCRLYPELWLAVLLSITSIIVYYPSIFDNFYILSVFAIMQSTIFQFWTPDILREFGCGVPNGALWTITVIVQSYIVLYYLEKYLKGKTIKIYKILLFIFCIISVLCTYLKNFVPLIIYKLVSVSFIPYLWLFCLGAILKEFFERFNNSLVGNCWIFALFSIVIKAIGIDIGFYGILTNILLGFAIIGFAYRYKNLELKYDFSYGIYIYHMVIINIFVELGFLYEYRYLFQCLVISIIGSIISFFTVGLYSRIIRKKVRSKLK